MRRLKHEKISNKSYLLMRILLTARLRTFTLLTSHSTSWEKWTCRKAWWWWWGTKRNGCTTATRITFRIAISGTSWWTCTWYYLGRCNSSPGIKRTASTFRSFCWRKLSLNFEIGSTGARISGANLTSREAATSLLSRGLRKQEKIRNKTRKSNSSSPRIFY